MKLALSVLLVPALASAAPSTADVTTLTAGFTYTCAGHADGAVSCWGDNAYGQLGDGTTTSSSLPVRMKIDDVAEVSADGNRLCVRKGAGTVACFGAISPTTLRSTTAVAIPTSDVVQLAGSCWRTSNGAAACLSNEGQVVAVAGVADAIDIAANGGVGCIVRKTGKVACWFDPNGPKPIAGVNGAVDVEVSKAIGSETVCARTKTGATSCWDWGFEPEVLLKRAPRTPPPPPKPPKQLPVQPAAIPGVAATALAGGREVMCAITARDVRCWDLRKRRATTVKGVGAVTALAISEHRCALRGKRDVVCWGPGTSGELGFGWARARPVPTPIAGVTDAVEVVASFAPGTNAGWTCARRKTDSVMCWGNVSPHNSSISDAKPREVWKKAKRIVRGMVAGAIDANGKWFNSVWGSKALDLPPVVDAAGDCAATKDNRVLCTGDHRPNNDNFNDPSHPDGDGVALVGLTDVAKFAIGGNFACALKRSGQPVCFSERGRLLHEKITDAIDLAAGTYTLCAVRKGGTVWCKGQNGSWLLKGDPLKSRGDSDWTQIPGLADVVELSLGADHGCARTSKGVITCWGDNDDGQLGDGTLKPRTTPAPIPNLTGVAQIAAGANHTCALLTSGAVTCWGEANAGQVGSYAMDMITEPTSVVW